jgi:hypothetical protein
MSWGAVIGAAGAIGGALISKNGSKSTTTGQGGTSTTALDPAIAKLLGTSGDGGILGGLSGTLSGGSNLPGIGKDFVNANGGQILNNGYASTNSLMAGSYQAPSIEAAQVRAPAQNNIDLTGSYKRFIDGTPGANPYLDQSINGAIATNRLGFQQLQDDSTKNLMQTILPSIRSNSVLAGQYGGSRQGIAEGNAIGTQQTELARAAGQFGQNATNAAVGAKANAYETDSNRALAATQGLGAQQYAAAMQDAQQRQAGDNTNVSALLATRGQNDSNITNGIGLQQGLLGAAAGYGNTDLTRLGTTAGILQPFLNAGSTTTTTGNVTQPVYQNTGGNILGGAMLGSQLGGMFGGGTSSSGAKMGSMWDLFGSGSTFGNYGA